MLTATNPAYQTNLFGTDLLEQLDQRDPLLQRAQAIPWSDFEQAFAKHYTQRTGRPSKPIRLMVGLLLLKQLENLSDEAVVLQFKRTPYYPAFCGLTEFSRTMACHSTERVPFRKRIGTAGSQALFQMSVQRHDNAALAKTVNIDTTVQEKFITYPTDAKLAIKILNRLNKRAKAHGIQQRRTYEREVKALRLNSRHFRPVKRRSKARQALKRLRTIAHTLMRELRRTLPQWLLFEGVQTDFLLDERVLHQQPKDSNKSYSLHEPQVSCIGKGKDHKPDEYGNQVSIATTARSNILVGVASHEHNGHDSKTLPEVLNHVETSRGQPAKEAVCDRGYRGRKTVGDTAIILPGTPLQREHRYQRDKKRKRGRRRAAIEPLIGHLKSDFRLTRNFLKGVTGDRINVLMAACAWNLNPWLRQAFLLLFCLVGRCEPAPQTSTCGRISRKLEPAF